MASKNTLNGKAFEYACLKSIKKRLNSLGLENEVIVQKDVAYQTAKNLYKEESIDDRCDMDAAAETAVDLLFPLEPRLEHGSGEIYLGINTDAAAQGVDGDVRDVLCIRCSSNWQIGLSCKHNHEALKHPRITAEKDFGTDWVGYSCSKEYMDEITPIIDPLIEFGEKGILWRNISNKKDLFYLPILDVYVNEIRRLCDQHEDVPKRLLSYFFGSKDFYKVIAKIKSKTTKLEGFNMNGTLGAPAGKIRPVTKVPQLKMPTRLIEATLKPKSKTTIILTFDGGWAVSMRLHNKDKVAKPTSLAWDVQLVGLPTETYFNIHSWNE